MTTEQNKAGIITEYLDTICDLKVKNKIYQEMLAEAKLILTQEKYANDPAVQHMIGWMNKAGVKAFPTLNYDV